MAILNGLMSRLVVIEYLDPRLCIDKKPFRLNKLTGVKYTVLIYCHYIQPLFFSKIAPVDLHTSSHGIFHLHILIEPLFPLSNGPEVSSFPPRSFTRRRS